MMFSPAPEYKRPQVDTASHGEDSPANRPKVMWTGGGPRNEAWMRRKIPHKRNNAKKARKMETHIVYFRFVTANSEMICDTTERWGETNYVRPRFRRLVAAGGVEEEKGDRRVNRHR
jgi:hypothetical protein